MPEAREVLASPWMGELAVDADAAGEARASEWLDTTCGDLGVPQAQTQRLVLCLHEVLANIADHGGDAARAEPVQLRLEIRRDVDGGTASVTVSDAGGAFDPLSAPERSRPKTLEEASASGMGLDMIRRLSDLLRYRHENGCNHFTFGMRWNAR